VPDTQAHVKVAPDPVQTKPGSVVLHVICPVAEFVLEPKGQVVQAFEFKVCE
jgi:hypothetical protein